MGTNFYWKRIPTEFEKYKANVKRWSVYGFDNNHENVLKHIGKRSAAGLYCSECGTTLNKHGTDHVHDCEYSEWYEVCPICGKEGTLIFSFQWTLMLHKWLIELYAKKGRITNMIVDEYGREYTPQEFLQSAKTPIEYQACCEFS